MVEGYMDVVALNQHGIGNVVATLGTATTRDHLVKLFRISREIVFSFDGDAAGSKAAWRALQTALPEIRDGRQLRFLFLPDGHDPDSLVNEEGEQAFRERSLTCHPDKVAHLDPEFQQLAEEKFKRLLQAYDLLAP